MRAKTDLLVKVIDPSKPSYTGDPHAFVVPDPESQKLFPDSLQLCKDRITFWVPDGAVQPD